MAADSQSLAARIEQSSRIAEKFDIEIKGVENRIVVAASREKQPLCERMLKLRQRDNIDKNLRYLQYV